MKVFDFTDGIKGKQVGDMIKPDALGGWYVKKGDQTFRIELVNPNNVHPSTKLDREGISWEWNSDACHESDEGLIAIDPLDFGVEAICFCTGKWNSCGHAVLGNDEWTWQWHVIGTNEWNRKACKAEILKATKLTT